MAVLVTGAAGFIGAATSRVLLERGDEVVGIDNLNDYYDPTLKQARLHNLQREYENRFRFARADVSDNAAHRQNPSSPIRESLIYTPGRGGGQLQLWQR